MRTKSYLFLALIILAIVVLTAYGQKQTSKRQIWEYKTVYSRIIGFEGEKTFNQLGAEGWELVAASGESDIAGVTYIFKRTR